ncbi:hypothetical protein [Caulobacter sp. S45]|uniref:hypothetical protein n=1 Tax=Caulobacter sp. S45 TaxID=1641861 RepID=UPI00131A81FE|nr:hypothetical protein [Caulobacter sp. S45]
MIRKLKSGRTATLAVAFGAVALSAGLSGCGGVGPLERPAPLLGAENKRDYYADKEAKARAAANKGDPNAVGSADREAGDDNAPLTTRDVQDPTEKLTNPRNSPVPGAPNMAGPTTNVTPY